MAVNHGLGNDSSPLPDGSVEAAGVGSLSAAAADDSGHIKSSLAGNPRMMKIIPQFVDGLAVQVREMTDLLQRSDLIALRQLVHQLGDACGGWGFSSVSETAARAEISIKADNAPEAIKTEINSLIEIIRRIDGYDESKKSSAGEESVVSESVK
jgi:HPt (histidine-containing phosphotransfer) domain-containing protein